MSLLDRFRGDSGEKPTRVDMAPRSGSGRGHTAGFLDLEEYNSELAHPYGHTIYDRMYRTDGDTRQVVSLVCNPIIAGTWAVEPYGGENATEEDIKVAEFVRWALWEAMKPGLLGHLAEFLPVVVRSGFAPGEVSWMAVEYEGELKLVPRTVALRLPRSIEQFEQDRYGNLTRIKQYLPTPISAVTQREGGTPNTSYDAKRDGTGHVWLRKRDLVYYRLGAEGDNWEGVSLLRPAYKHWLMKDAIERIDAIAQEREALGVPICYPPMGASSAQLDATEEILAGMRTNEEGYILAPGPKAGEGAPEGQGWLFEVIGYDRTGSGRDPMPSLEYHTLKIAAAFISEFMRLGHGATGARATAQVQADPFLMSVEALVSVIEPAITEALVMPLVAYNFAGVKNAPKLKMSLVDATNLAQLADFVQKLIMVGALVPDQDLEDFLRARADLPPADPEVIKKRAKQDDELRREIIVGPADQGFDAPGANDKPGAQHGTKTAPGSDPGGRGGTNRNTARDAAANHIGAMTLEHDRVAVTMLFEGGMPEYIAAVAGKLLGTGTPPARAIATAVNVAKRHCATGAQRWPGLSDLDLTQAGACEAARWVPGPMPDPE